MKPIGPSCIDGAKADATLVARRTPRCFPYPPGLLSIVDGLATYTAQQETLVFDLRLASRRALTRAGRVTELDGVRHGLNAAPMSPRHDFVFAAPHP